MIDNSSFFIIIHLRLSEFCILAYIEVLVKDEQILVK